MFETPATALGLNSNRILAGIGIGLLVLCCALSGLFWYSWVGFLILTLILHLIRDEERTRLIKNLASDTGLTFIGDRLPRLFPIQYTSSRQAHSISRVVVGEDLLLFDCRIGHGKISRGRTVVAARKEASVFGWARFGPDLETETASGWTLVYGSNRLLELEEINALMSEFAHHRSQEEPDFE